MRDLTDFWITNIIIGFVIAGVVIIYISPLGGSLIGLISFAIGFGGLMFDVRFDFNIINKLKSWWS
jgi:hypothetical protein